VCIPALIGMSVAYREYFDNSGGVQEKYHSRSETSDKKIAILRVEGTIMSGEGYERKQIERIRNDEKVVGVVLRVNSPGGTISGSDYIYHHLRAMCQERQLPLVVSMGGLAASGGYYISMAVGDQENSIYAEPTTTTGSIGVIFPHYDVSGLLAQYNIEDGSIVSNPRKQLASMTREMPPEHREILQKYVDDAFGRFRDIVLEGRPKFREQPEELDRLATGEIFTAQSALESGLVDKIGFLEDAIDRAAELAQVDPEKVRVIEYQSPLGLLDVLQAKSSGARPMSVDFNRAQLEATLLDMSAPRAFYLYTTLPYFVRSY
jgi:protease-4